MVRKSNVSSTIDELEIFRHMDDAKAKPGRLKKH